MLIQNPPDDLLTFPRSDMYIYELHFLTFFRGTETCIISSKLRVKTLNHSLHHLVQFSKSHLLPFLQDFRLQALGERPPEARLLPIRPFGILDRQ